MTRCQTVRCVLSPFGWLWDGMRPIWLVDLIVKEATETQPHAENFNREAAFILSCKRQPVINLMKHSPQPGIHRTGQVQ
jgi:hypothetical protein